MSNMVRKMFCDKCGRELKAHEAIQLLGYDLCSTCCKEVVKSG
jgi:predicted amidophosphoribosyltransferase